MIEEEQLRLLDRQQETGKEVQRLQGFLTVCAYCNRVRDGEGKWIQRDRYAGKHFFREISHGICPECMEIHYPEEYAQYRRERKK